MIFNVDLIYPVGSLYFNVNSTSPSVLFGGKWEQIQDKFILACGTKHKANEIGGEETHKLTQEEMPSHSHKMGNALRSWVSSGTYIWPNNGDLNKADEVSQTENTGGDKPHNNMPPYLAVYVWQRVA